MDDIDLWIKSDVEFFNKIRNSKTDFEKTLCEIWDLTNLPVKASQWVGEELIKKANQVSFDERNNDMILLFLNHLIFLDISFKRYEEANILTQRVESLITNVTKNEIIALYYLNKGMIDGYLKKLEFKADYYYKQALELVGKKSRLYTNCLYQLMEYYAYQGRLIDLDVKDTQQNVFVNYFHLVNQFEQADFINFEITLKTLRKNSKGNNWINNNINELEIFFNYYVYNHKLTEDVPWILAFKKLREHDYDGALKISNQIVKDESSSILMTTAFSSYTHIRSQLSCGNAQAALVLLEEKKINKYDSYIDDFFIGRALFLLKEKEKSIQYFISAYKNCKKYGALNRFDFEIELSREFTPSLIRLITERAFLPSSEKNQLPEIYLKQKRPLHIEKIIGISDIIINIKETISSYANLNVPILILGETGVGKDLVAQSIHESSDRSNNPFLAINCGAISPNLLQSELFGHLKGSFSGANTNHKGFFETAGAGTIFLDEIGEVSPDMQIALLRVLENKEFRPVGSATAKPYNCRIIAATNAPLEKLTETGMFRKDLYYRLKRFTLEIPPLRERPEDIKPLVKSFLRMGFDNDSQVDCDENLWKALLNYEWPGNIRELKNEIEKMRILNSHIFIFKLEDALFLKSKTTSISKSALPSHIQDKTQLDVITEDIENQALNSNNKTKFRRLEKIKKLFQKNKRLARMEVCQILGVANQTIGNDFKELIAEGFLEKIEPTASPRTHYFILKESSNINKKYSEI